MNLCQQSLVLDCIGIEQSVLDLLLKLYLSREQENGVHTSDTIGIAICVSFSIYVDWEAPKVCQLFMCSSKFTTCSLYCLRSDSSWCFIDILCLLNYLNNGKTLYRWTPLDIQPFRHFINALKNEIEELEHRLKILEGCCSRKSQIQLEVKQQVYDLFSVETQKI